MAETFKQGDSLWMLVRKILQNTSEIAVARGGSGVQVFNHGDSMWILVRKILQNSTIIANIIAP